MKTNKQYQELADEYIETSMKLRNAEEKIILLQEELTKANRKIEDLTYELIEEYPKEDKSP